MISVLQASAWYPPDSWGGTEVYLTGLVRELRALGVTSTIIAPLGRDHADGYAFDGTTVRTYAVNDKPTRAELRGEEPHDGFSRFRDILLEVRPDIYHQHSWSRGLGLAHLRVARELGLTTVLTVHVPGVTCLRGTMMRYGTDACDGRIDPFTCAACWSESRGAPKSLAMTLAAASSKIGFLAEGRLPGRLDAAFSGFTMAQQRQADVGAMAQYSDRVVAVCQWLDDTLARNGVPPEKRVLSRQGVDPDFAAAIGAIAPPASTYAAPGIFRLLYVGRWHPVKGIDTVVRAVKAIPTDVPLELVIHGIGDGADERAYEASVRKLAGSDRRITIAAPVSRAALGATLMGASALAVPSRWLETGPLVVLEAKAVGLPILGSRLGGIAELVREPDDGLLIAPDDVAAWTDAIVRMIKTPSPRPERSRTAVRTMRDVASDMDALYRGLCVEAVPGEAMHCVSH